MGVELSLVHMSAQPCGNNRSMDPRGTFDAASANNIFIYIYICVYVINLFTSGILAIYMFKSMVGNIGQHIFVSSCKQRTCSSHLMMMEA
jgi:hypothetical protein